MVRGSLWGFKIHLVVKNTCIWASDLENHEELLNDTIFWLWNCSVFEANQWALSLHHMQRFWSSRTGIIAICRIIWRICFCVDRWRCCDIHLRKVFPRNWQNLWLNSSFSLLHLCGSASMRGGIFVRFFRRSTLFKHGLDLQFWKNKSNHDIIISMTAMCDSFIVIKACVWSKKRTIGGFGIICVWLHTPSVYCHKPTAPFNYSVMEWLT